MVSLAFILTFLTSTFFLTIWVGNYYLIPVWIVVSYFIGILGAFAFLFANLPIMKRTDITNKYKNYLILSIEDNGPGFSLDILKKAFEPYVTTKSHGTGLGLAIVKKIIEEHEGTIVVENIKNGGANINIQLPISKSK